MSDKNVAASGGTSITGLLGVVFVTLKLCEVIDWSWWWVLLPFYGPVALALFLLFAFLGIAGLVAVAGIAVVAIAEWSAK